MSKINEYISSIEKKTDFKLVGLRIAEWHVVLTAMAGFREHCSSMARIVVDKEEVAAALRAASDIAEVIEEIKKELAQGRNNESKG